MEREVGGGIGMGDSCKPMAVSFQCMTKSTTNKKKKKKESDTIHRTLSIAFLPRSKCLNFKAAVTICSDFGAQENKVCHCFPIYLPGSDGTRYPDLCLLKLSFKPTLSFSSFIKRLSSLLSALHI